MIPRSSPRSSSPLAEILCILRYSTYGPRGPVVKSKASADVPASGFGIQDPGSSGMTESTAVEIPIPLGIRLCTAWRSGAVRDMVGRDEEWLLINRSLDCR
jgi:hypothetical protein